MGFLQGNLSGGLQRQARLWVRGLDISSVWVLEKANYLSLNREPAEAQTQLLPKDGLLKRTEVSTWGVTQDRALSVGRGDIHDAIPRLGPQELRSLRPSAGAFDIITSWKACQQLSWIQRFGSGLNKG